MLSRLVILAVASSVFAVAFIQATHGILLGHEAKEGQFPYQVSLRREDTHVCGGMIISANYILTAVHCVAQVPRTGRYILREPTEYVIQAGSVDRTNGDVLVNVSSITAHENYGFNLNDVAVMKLEHPLTFSDNIQPIALTKEEPPAGAIAVVSGWGRLSENGPRPDKLQWVFVRHISRKECNQRTHINTRQVLCMDHPVNQGPCKGDSGGPAVYKKKLIGINSFLKAGCGSAKPDLYVNIAHYLPWIQQHTDL